MIKKYLLIILLMYFSSFSTLHAEERNAHFLLTIGHTDFKDDVFHAQGLVQKLGGGYRFSDFVSFEVSLISYGEVSDTNGTVETDMVGAAIATQLMGLLPITNSIDIFGKAGVSYWKFEIKSEDPPLISRASEDGSDVIYGAGFLFRVDHDSTLRLEYELSDIGGIDIAAISFEIQHQF